MKSTFKVRSLIEVLSNNRGSIGAEDGDIQDTLAAQAYEELAAEKEGREPKDLLSTPKKKDDKKDDETLDPDDEQANDGKDGDAGKGNEDDADDKADDGESSDDADDKKADDEDKSGDKEGDDDKAGDEDADKKITEYATKHGMTYAEAKDDMEKTAEIIKQYKNDPAEMARAMRNKDREYHKLKAQTEKKDENKAPLFQRMTDDQFRKYARGKIAERPVGDDGEEKESPFIRAYRAQFPAKTESMTDEAIIEEIAEQELGIYREKAAQKEHEIKTTAQKKREELIAKVAETDRRFIPEVKALLLETGDGDILSEAMDISDVITYAKGKHYDSDIKAAEERGFKRGKEGAKIVGVKGSTEGTSRPSSKTGTVSLNGKQKQRAVEMYGANYEDEECYRLFKETFEDDLKKNPNFV